MYMSGTIDLIEMWWWAGVCGLYLSALTRRGTPKHTHMTNYTIKVKANTIYQFNGLRYFALPIILNPDGSYVSEIAFETIEDARQFLMDVADRYYDDIHERSEAYDSINSFWSCLEIDAVTAIIEESI
jgi:hypothetical protein